MEVSFEQGPVLLHRKSHDHSASNLVAQKLLELAFGAILAHQLELAGHRHQGRLSSQLTALHSCLLRDGNPDA